jgi:hypothetical protein
MTWSENHETHETHEKECKKRIMTFLAIRSLRVSLLSCISCVSWSTGLLQRSRSWFLAVCRVVSFLAGADFVRNMVRCGGEPMAAVKALVPVVALPRADVRRPDAPRCAGECVRRVRSIATDHPENAAIVIGSGEPAKTGAACAHRCLGPLPPSPLVQRFFGPN